MSLSDGKNPLLDCLLFDVRKYEKIEKIFFSNNKKRHYGI